MQQKKPIHQDKPAHVYGKWVLKTTKSTIFLCACGAKYLKTRKNQTTCIACMRIGR